MNYISIEEIIRHISSGNTCFSIRYIVFVSRISIQLASSMMPKVNKSYTVLSAIDHLWEPNKGAFCFKIILTIDK